MTELTGKERVARQLKHLPVDRIAVMEQFWNHTISHWVEQGTFPPGESPEDHFNLDIAMNWTFNLKINPDMQDKLVAEDGGHQDLPRRQRRHHAPIQGP